MMTRTLALFGGSFDPPHVGHVLAVTWAISTAPIDGVMVMPAFDHAFDKELRPFPDRFEMARLAFEPLARVEVSDLEARLGGESFTVRTLEHLRDEHPDTAWRLLIGSDVVDQLPRWERGERVIELAPPLVVGRGGHARAEDELPMPQVSSTEVRRRLRAGAACDSLVPRAVLRYIADRGLYRS